MHPYLMTIPALEATLTVLYATACLTEENFKHRAELARAYYDRTGKYFAARFYN